MRISDLDTWEGLDYNGNVVLTGGKCDGEYVRFPKHEGTECWVGAVRPFGDSLATQAMDRKKHVMPGDSLWVIVQPPSA